MPQCRPILRLLAAGACLFLAASVAFAQRRASLPLATYEDRLRGGWAGWLIGLSHGAPYDYRVRGKIDETLRPWQPEDLGRTGGRWEVGTAASYLTTLTGHGPELTRDQAATAFRQGALPVEHGMAAARENLRRGIEPAFAGHPRYNPHADDNELVAVAGLFGWLAPAMDRTSGRLCDTFGGVTHWGDGLYGGRFVAGMYGRAFWEPDPTPAAIARCIEAGLEGVPADSATARLIRDVVAAHGRDPREWRTAWKLLQDRWGGEDLCPDGAGTPLNRDAKLHAGYVTIALLYGDGELQKTLDIAVGCGQGTGVTAAAAAGFLGTLKGYRDLPRRHAAAFAGVAGLRVPGTNLDVEGMVHASRDVALRVLESQGGRRIDRGGGTVLEIPIQRALRPAVADQMRAFGKEKLEEWRREMRPAGGPGGEAPAP